MEPKWVVLLRFGDREHLEAFRRVGELYMNPLDYFTKLENDPLRADCYEGISHLYQPQSTVMIFDGPVGRFQTHPSDTIGPIRITQNADFDVNVFCMYAITDTVEDEVVDPRVRAFGDSCVLLLNQEEFFKRLRFSMMQEGLTGRATLVEYYDYDTYAGPVGPFRKSDAFAYQSEYRIVVRPGLRGPRKLFLGNIEDITSEIIPTSEINGRLKFREVDAREAGLIP